MDRPHRLLSNALAGVIGGVAVLTVLVGAISAQRAATPELQLHADGFPVAQDAVVPLDLDSEILRWRQQLLDMGRPSIKMM